MTINSYTIRPAQARDADAVTAMWWVMAQQHQAYDDLRWGWQDAAAAQDGWKKYFLGLLEKPEVIVLVAVGRDAVAAGYLVGGTGPTIPVMRARSRGSVDDMYVVPAARRQGIGRALMQRAVATMKARGAVYVNLFVACANQEAIEFYRSLHMQPMVHQMFLRL